MNETFALVGGSPALRALVVRYLGESFPDSKVEFFDRRLSLDFDWSAYSALVAAEFADALEAATSLEVITRAANRPPTVALGERFFDRYRSKLVRDRRDDILAVPFSSEQLASALQAGMAAKALAVEAARIAHERAKAAREADEASGLYNPLAPSYSPLADPRLESSYPVMNPDMNAVTATRIVPLMEHARWERTGVMVTPNAIPGYMIIGSAAPKSDAPVYLASSEADGKIVVLKLLDRMMKRSPHMREHALWRAQAVEQCGSMHVVRVIEKGHNAPIPFVALEYLRGGTLTDKLPVPADPARALRAVAQTLHGLHALHQSDLVHLDIKPSNLMWRDDATLVIVDVGVAVRTGSPPLATEQTADGLAIGGTPAYMSPEHGQGKAVDARADLYSVGVMLYELLTGALPFDAYNDAMMLYRHLHEEIPLLPKELSRYQPLIDTLMAKEANDRPLNAKQALALVAEHSI
jgi:hypothetical protein